MPQYSVRVSEGLGERIEAYTDEYDGSKSDALRELLSRGTEYDSIQRDRDALQNQLNTLAGREREHGELVEYVKEERSLQQRREERERSREERKRAWEQAPIWTKLKWRVVGRHSPEA